MRDILGGFPIRDLDFSVEGNALKLAKEVAKKTGAKLVGVDEDINSAELLFPGAVTASISMARQGYSAKPGSKPHHATPATIYEDLRKRDFTFNAMALSLNRASLGLLIDPNNGLADLERKEIRAVHNYIFCEDPSRILRLVRFQVRFGFAVEERTRQQYENARLDELERSIPARKLFEELKQIAQESNPGDVLVLFEREKLLHLFLPALKGAKLNLQGFAKLQKARQMIPFGVNLHIDEVALFLYVLTEKFTPGEKAALIKTTSMRKSEVEAWQKLPLRSRKAERELRSAKLRKASLIYRVASKVPGEEILYLLLYSSYRLVQDRIKNYLQKYLPAAQEVTEKQVIAAGGVPGTPGFYKVREALIASRLDGRPRKTSLPAAEQELELDAGGQKKNQSSGKKSNGTTNQPQDVSVRRKPRSFGTRSQ